MQIADEVVAIIAGLAATEVEGVDSMAGNITNELVGKLGMKNLSKGVKVEVTEDHVWDNRYYQMNRFGGGDEELGGFENLKGRITEDFEFNHVARALYGDWEGYPGRFPKEITAGESYDNDFKLDLPTTILDMNNARIIGMVIDNASGKVLNANVMSLGTGSLDLVGEDASGLIRVEPSASGVRVVGLGLMDVTVSDLSGRTVARVSANGTADVQIDTCGIYIVTVKGDNGCVAVKVAI